MNIVTIALVEYENGEFGIGLVHPTFGVCPIQKETPKYGLESEVVSFRTEDEAVCFAAVFQQYNNTMHSDSNYIMTEDLLHKFIELTST